MENTLYLECYSGISGDMTVAALIDLGADQEVLKSALKSLKVDGFDIKISRVLKSGIDVCDFDVILDSGHENHDHDMEYLYGKDQAVHNHHGEDHEHTHEHRNLEDIYKIIHDAALTPNAKVLAKKIFMIIARAEAKAHNASVENVHFHEVGAVDSIVDVVAAAVCLDNLNITKAVVKELYEGQGIIRCQHGFIPIPAPAVLNIVEDNSLRLHITDTPAELVTPTGAAIVAAIKTSDVLFDRFTIIKTGLGAGKRNYDRPGILRAMLIKDSASGSEQKDTIVKMEANIDDCTGESLGYVMDKLFEAGARDVHYIPVYMKKNRPAYQINIICSKNDVEKLEHIIFTETTTIGIRHIDMYRTILPRKIDTIKTSLGEVTVKICELEDSTRIYPEYSSITAICRDKNMCYQDVYNTVIREIKIK